MILDTVAMPAGMVSKRLRQVGFACPCRTCDDDVLVIINPSMSCKPLDEIFTQIAIWCVDKFVQVWKPRITKSTAALQKVQSRG